MAKRKNLFKKAAALVCAAALAVLPASSALAQNGSTDDMVSVDAESTTYTITYYSMLSSELGISGSDESATVTYDSSSITLKSLSDLGFTESPQSSSYSFEFVGWSTDVNDSWYTGTYNGSVYSAGDSFTYTSSGSKTLYAVWRDNTTASDDSGTTYTVNYKSLLADELDVDSGNEYASVTYSSSPITLASLSYLGFTESPQSSAYTFEFLGWSTSENDSWYTGSYNGTFYSAGDSFAYTSSGSTTLYAVWSEASGTDISGATVTLSSTSYTYTGSAITPSVTVTLSGTTLTKGTDYTVAYSNNTNAGTATVTVTGKGNYIGTKTANFNIKQVLISVATITLSKTSYTYTGSAIKPSVTVKITLNGKTKTLSKGADYTVSYSNNKKVGTGTVMITGKGNYKGTKSKTFKIVRADQKITAKNVSKTYKTSSGQILYLKYFSLSAKTSGDGKITYTKTSGNSKVTVGSAGKVTVKKGLKKGTYKIKVKVKAAKTTNYNMASKVLTITLYVK